MKAVRYILLIVLTSLATQSQAMDYKTLATKAERFYSYGEWTSALAMYQLMLDHDPHTPQVYARAITAAGLDGDPAEQERLLQQSIKALVPLDSVFEGVRKYAFEQGNAPLYEDFLKTTAQRIPWLKRSIDSRLLDYYAWRRNGAGMVEYAHTMLAGMPDDIGFLTMLADGLFTIGEERKAIETYERIVTLAPDNYHALLVLGNYYAALSGQRRSDTVAVTLARQFLNRAQAIKSSPYVAALLRTL